MSGRTARQHAVLLFAVLAGLFLMHGLTAGGVVGCHGTAVMTHPMRSMHPEPGMHAQPVASPAVATTAAATPQAAEQTVTGDPQPMTDHAQAGESCIPLRPEGLSGLFLALFLIVITLWRPRLPRSAHLIRPRWPHGPPRTGIQVLRTLSISRT